MKTAAIITAAGQGNRMSAEIPKQFMLLDALPILLRTLLCFRAYDSEMPIVLVIPARDEHRCLELLSSYKIDLDAQLIHGGSSRSESVYAGLKALGTAPDLRVAIHDGVRPLLSVQLIEHCFRALDYSRAVIPVLPLSDTIRQQTAQGLELKDRSKLFRCQTPQCFYLSDIQEAYRAALQTGTTATDDAAIFTEYFGSSPTTVPGEERNIKITYQQDLALAEALLQQAR